MNAAYGSDEGEEEGVEFVPMAESGVRSGVVEEAMEDVPKVGSAFVINANARNFLNDGSRNDPKWEKPEVDEVVVGKRGIDWRVDYSEYLRPRLYGRFVRRDRVRRLEVGTKESAERLLAVLARRPEGVEVREDEDGIRTLRMAGVGNFGLERSSER